MVQNFLQRNMKNKDLLGYIRALILNIEKQGFKNSIIEIIRKQTLKYE